MTTTIVGLLSSACWSRSRCWKFNSVDIAKVDRDFTWKWPHRLDCRAATTAAAAVLVSVELPHTPPPTTFAFQHKFPYQLFSFILFAFLIVERIPKPKKQKFLFCLLFPEKSFTVLLGCLYPTGKTKNQGPFTTRLHLVSAYVHLLHAI